MSKIKCFIGLHNPLKCFRYSEVHDKDETEIDLNWQGIWAYDTRVKVDPFSIWKVIESRYRCSECKRKFWYARTSFEEIKSNQRFVESLTIKSHD